MCARYDVIHNAQELARELGATLANDIAPRATIAPTDVAPVLIGGETRALVPMRFGWPSDRPRSASK